MRERFYHVPDPAPIRTRSREKAGLDVENGEAVLRTFHDEECNFVHPDKVDNRNLQETHKERFTEDIDSRKNALKVFSLLLLLALLFVVVNLTAQRQEKPPMISPVSAWEESIKEDEAEQEDEMQQETGEVQESCEQQIVEEQQETGDGEEQEKRGYLLRFELNLPDDCAGYERNTSETVVFRPGMTAPVPDVPEDYSFLGWGTAPTEPERIISAGEIIPLLTEETVLYGLWQRREAVTDAEMYNEI